MIQSRKWPAVEPDRLPLTESERAILDYWLALRGNAIRPARTQVLPEELAPWIGWLHLIEVVDGGADFIYRIFGDQLSAQTGFDMSRTSVRQWEPKFRFEMALSLYGQVAESGQPHYHANTEIFSEESHRTFTRIVLPLGDAETVTHILVLLSRRDDVMEFPPTEILVAPSVG